MGHKGGNKFSGARGRKEPREVMRRDELSEETALEVLSEAHDEDIREMARKHCPAAVKTLRGLMEARRTPPSVKRQCARDLIEIGHGKVGSREAGETGQTAGLTINIVNLAGGDRVEVKTLSPQTVALERKPKTVEEEVPSLLIPDWEPEDQTDLVGGDQLRAAAEALEEELAARIPTPCIATDLETKLAVRRALQTGQWPPILEAG